MKKINIRGTLLDRNQLAKHMEKTASEHNIRSNSKKDTFPIQRLIDDYNFILDTYNLLSKHLKLGIKVHSAGEWILDNFYIIEETSKTVQKELTLKKYKNMIGLSNEEYTGFSRCYVLAEEMTAFSDCKIDRELIDICLKSYQRKKVLSMEELASLGIYLKISLISNIRDLCEKIYLSQIQKYKVENIIERLVEKNKVSKFSLKSKTFRIVEEKTKYAFIEYMSYKLKLYGKDAIKYQNIFEKEVQKTGVSISEVIQKEHFNIANIKVTMGNCITSIKEINRINFSETFGYMNASEEILKEDPAGVYVLMDEESKSYYRRLIEEKARKTKISEIYISEKIIELCMRFKNSKNEFERKKSHVGYYLLVKEGKEELNEILELKFIKGLSVRQKSRLYIASSILIPLYCSFVLFMLTYVYYKKLVLSLILFISSYLPFAEIFLRIENYLLGKFKKPVIVPKIDYDESVPENRSTFIVIPTILKSKEKVKEMFDKLEVYYLANKSKNLYFAILGDCSEEKVKRIDEDNEVISTGLELCEKLNAKYQTDGFNIFHFLYRERKWNDSEASYIGWERKRGILTTFNKYIKKKVDNDFLVNTIEFQKEILPNIKYIITLDSDTNLNLNTAFKLIGAMSHILNEPVVKDDKVIDGYGIMQPRIGMDLDYFQKTYFIELFSMKGGIDCYTNAISDIYQDYFKEGIFTGKGIYDVDVYNQILENEFPENTILSHDLLEGNFLRCGLLTDVMLLDGYPLRYIPYIFRNHRWTRGDWQIIKWLNSSRLNELSKFKIYDNLRRSLNLISAFIMIFIGGLSVFKYEIINYFFIITSFIMISIPFLLDIINYIIFKESNIYGAVYAHKKFSKELKTVEGALIRIILQIAFLPYEAYKMLDSIIRSIYRMKKKTKLLEWMTAEDGDKKSKTDLKYHFKEMIFNFFIGSLYILLVTGGMKFLGILWCVAPIIAWFISLDRESKTEIIDSDRVYLMDVAKRTWDFFENYITEENNYLMPDNYQEDRNNTVVNRTSSTNIGLELLAIISAYDLKFISFKKTMEYLSKVLSTISGLSKWNGHLYNWYDIKTLLPLVPRYISTVDSGNFVGYLYIVREFLESNKNKYDIENLYKIVNELIYNTDFSKLYSSKDKLLSIGFNLEENKLTDSYYDFLASEARQASIVAIAKGDVPVKHWNNLSRTLTSLNGYKGLVSWTGTAFEYLMPNVNLKRYKGSLLDEASSFAIMSQIEYCKKMGVPWGISESAFDVRDLNNNYQYKAFGIPWLGLKRGLEDDLVISPYSTFLSLEDKKTECVENLRKIELEGGKGKYGFYESIDYTASRKGNQKHKVVKTYMAHHQGLILLSINNYLNNMILRKRFNNNPEIEATNILLQERMPIKLIITKEKKEKVIKDKSVVFNSYIERVIDATTKVNKNYNVISNEKYRIIIDDQGSSMSEYEGLMVNSYKDTSDLWQGFKFYIKNVKNKKIIDVYKKCKVVFAPDKAKFIKIENNLKIDTTVSLDPNKAIEIRRIGIENLGNSDEVLEVISDFEPSLSRKMQEYSHPAFNKLFMKLEKINENIIFEKKDRNNKDKVFLATCLYTENEQIVDLEYEICKEKYLGRENLDIPQMIKTQKAFSKEITQVTNPIIAMKRTIKVRAKEKVYINLLVSVSREKEDSIENLENIKSEEEIVRSLNIARVRSEEESKYLQIDGKKIERYVKFLKYIIKPNKQARFCDNLNFDSFWKYGISGDNPIVLVKIKNLEDIYVLDDILDAFQYYRAKNIYIDLIIFNEEINVYERYVKDNINFAIANKQLDYLKDKNCGIFVINKDEMLMEDFEAIEVKSRIIIDASKGSLDEHIKEYENTNGNVDIKRERNFELASEIYPEKHEKMLYGNSYGGFIDNGKKYLICSNYENKLPSVWCNILCNKFFGGIVTNNLGGYTWSKNSRLNRLTAWNNDSVLDIPSEIYYIKNEDNKNVWTINSGVIPNMNYYYTEHGLGFTKYKNVNDNINQELDVFVPNEEPLKIMNFKIQNLINETRNLKLLVYIKPVLGEDEYLTQGNISVEKINNFLVVKNAFRDEAFKEKIMFVGTNLPINSFTGEKDDFFGEGDILNPDSLYKNLNNASGFGKQACIGMEILLKLDKLESKEFNIIIGEENNVEKIKEYTNKYENEKNVKEELERCFAKWNDIVNIVKVKTPSDSINVLMNNWLIYQTITSRLFGKTGYYQSGGAYGFRDQLQDCLGIKYIDSNFLKDQIINAARHQFLEGDVLHWWHNETKKGIRTRFSDDLLWLVYAVIEYVQFENDFSILEEEVEYLTGESLSENEYEKYDLYHESQVKENVFIHCIRAIDCTLEKGIDPFPKIGIGDWNDGFSNVGAKGKGQSIWLGFFLYDILNRFIPICERMDRKDISERYLQAKERLKKNLNSVGWDGRWFKRAITDDGKEMGSINSEECRIDSIAQSWAVISGASDNDKKFIAIQEAENYLIDKENKLIKLFDPPFEKSSIEPGYIKAYPPGIRENGGQYTHAACWLLIAETLLGFGDKALELIDIINPIEHSKNKEEAKKYKLEPYIIPADVYSNKDLIGQGGWNWYTGSSSWFYKAILENVLGLKIEYGYIYVKPCICKSWKEYEIQYKYKTTLYNIKIKNNLNKNTGINSFVVNGQKLEEQRVLLVDDGKIYNVEIFM